MNRLTKDLNTPHDDTTYSNIVANCCDRENIVLTKLKHYENLEEKLGIDLLTLFEFLKGHIWALHPITKNPCLIIYPALYYCDNQWVIGCQSMQWNDEANNYDCWECLLKDYGKTWAKSLKELKNENTK